VGIEGDKDLTSMPRSTSSTSSVASNAMDRGKHIEIELQSKYIRDNPTNMVK
jgi:hypothetical protein